MMFSSSLVLLLWMKVLLGFLLFTFPGGAVTCDFAALRRWYISVTALDLVKWLVRGLCSTWRNVSLLDQNIQSKDPVTPMKPKHIQVSADITFNSIDSLNYKDKWSSQCVCYICVLMIDCSQSASFIDYTSWWHIFSLQSVCCTWCNNSLQGQSYTYVVAHWFLCSWGFTADIYGVSLLKSHLCLIADGLYHPLAFWFCLGVSGQEGWFTYLGFGWTETSNVFVKNRQHLKGTTVYKQYTHISKYQNVYLISCAWHTILPLLSWVYREVD